MEQEEAITAVVRIRPAHPSEDKIEFCLTATTTGISMPAPRQNSPSSNFTFSAVYGPRHSEGTLYDAHIAPLVASFVDGYNACVMAFGQTGSGKTYTMSQIVPLAITDIFQRLQSTKDSEVKMSHLEVYNEALRDLLHPLNEEPLVIREDSYNSNIIVHGLEPDLIYTAEEAMACVRRGNAQRITAATALNDISSRSHSIITMHLRRGNETFSKFHFIDLAGSERNKRTKNTGIRFKESVGINSGLLALQNVLRALSRNLRRQVGHVPFRQSKLTRILQDSLGGNSRTVFIGCVAPTKADADETLRTLQYTSQAMCIRNHPTLNIDESLQVLEEDRGGPPPREDHQTNTQQTEYIKELERKLHRANVDLQKDEIIFAQKMREIRELKKANSQLRTQLREKTCKVGLQTCNALLAQRYENCHDIVLPFGLDFPLHPCYDKVDAVVSASMACPSCSDLQHEMAYYKHTVNILRQQMKTLIIEHDRLVSFQGENRVV